jgi:Zn-dependent M28 family amino/carboxypeptidase
VAIFIPALWPRLVAWIASIYIAFMLFILVDREFRCSITPGANDNASGVAVLLSLADSLVAHPLAPDTDVWLVATGCEEAGTVGMLRFLQQHGSELPKATTTFINIDNVGAGNITFTTAEGILLPLKTDPVLNEAAIAFAQNYPEYNVKGHGYHALTTDALIPLSKRRRAISIMAFDARGRLPNWHWHTDTIDNIDPETIIIARDLVAYVIRSIAW